MRSRQNHKNSTPASLIAIKFIKENPHIVHKRTIARNLVELYPDIFISVEHARSKVRSITLCNGVRDRERKHKFEPIELKLPDFSDDESWQIPYKISTKKIAIIGDLHGQFVNESALNCALSVCKEQGIKDLLINGDLLDNYYLSKFAKKADRMKVREEFDLMKSLLEKIRPDFDNIWFKLGNHDRYVDRFFMNYPGTEGLVTLDERLTLTKLKIKEIHDLQQIVIGDLNVLHGHEKPGFFTPEFVAKSVIKWWQSYSGRMDIKILVNHHHITDNFIQRNIDGSFAYGYVVGSMCRRMSYNPYPRHNTGMAIVTVENGISKVENFEV